MELELDPEPGFPPGGLPGLSPSGRWADVVPLWVSETVLVMLQETASMTAISVMLTNLIIFFIFITSLHSDLKWSCPMAAGKAAARKTTAHVTTETAC